MDIKKIITKTALVGLMGAGIFGGCSEEQKKGVIEKKWVDGDGFYNASVYLTSDTGRVLVRHPTTWMTPILDSLFDTGDSVTVERQGHYVYGIDYYYMVK